MVRIPPASRIRLVASAAILSAVAMFSIAAPAAAATSKLRIDPASSSVAKGSTVTVKVIQNSDIATSGAQVTVTFNKAIVQIKSIAKGAAYANAPIWVPPDLSSVIASANSSGTLQTVAVALMQPDSVPAGDQEVLVITFTAVACGQSTVGLPAGDPNGLLLDGRDATYGKSLGKPTTTSGAIVVCGAAGSGTPGASDSQGQGESASPGPNDTAATSSGSPAPTASGNAAGSECPSACGSLSPSASPFSNVAGASSGSSGGGGNPIVLILLVAVVVVGGSAGVFLLMTARPMPES